MRSFSTLSVLFTAALSAFTYAAPTGPTDALKLPNVGDLTKLGSTVPVQTRETPASVAVIFTNVQETIIPLTDKFTFITPANATAAEITPIIGQIKDCLLTATVSLKALVGLELSVILAPVEGTVQLTVAEVAKLVGGVLCVCNLSLEV
ncbi:hypothetical protein BV22DRAFT_611664 [Leucogyrophana mollusca]|uniref:Uncharacterized protein n=1 Tax=Leucogyrophana mollusca TaxID=85980 RepID=A0ACB8BE30_9AGAM|nr:hypothetical protein BV22DRAFT_611664 [Leucogyrophana mollusca]